MRDILFFILGVIVFNIFIEFLRVRKIFKNLAKDNPNRTGMDNYADISVKEYKKLIILFTLVCVIGIIIIFII